ncbi:Lrp/AsnC family transcriptional regulator [Kiloniella laminariae]|uniref:Lrp/AsnC family transcriptional regulator n=1 Tax=Kiloniella laminariae TaxID=454162 RepID=A0ABT4LG87_9PROT|nr:Lrp/AsnC family transcriptional regulator [Kiloniella laminariae]MCZ4280117.1 Lrp/AsnC family transcriptional regulator [Kiloniella laminariae]
MIELDPVDIKILSLLQKDSTLPTAEIAERVGLSQSPCWRRIKRFRDEGLIRKEVCLLDPRTVGLGVTVFATVTLLRHSEENARQFEAIVARRPEIMECYTVTGDRDYLLRIVAKDIEAYDRMITDQFLHLSIIQSVSSRFALRSLKYTTELPL